MTTIIIISPPPPPPPPPNQDKLAAADTLPVGTDAASYNAALRALNEAMSEGCSIRVVDA